MPSASAACCCTEPNNSPELVPDPVTNAPTAPMTGAINGNNEPVTAMQNDDTAEIMPAYPMTFAQPEYGEHGDDRGHHLLDGGGKPLRTSRAEPHLG